MRNCDNITQNKPREIVMSFFKNAKGIIREMATVNYTADMYEISDGKSIPAGVAYASVWLWQRRYEAIIQMEVEIKRSTGSDGGDTYGKVIVLSNVRMM